MLQFTYLFTGFTCITNDSSTVSGVNSTFAIDGKPAKDRLSITDTPLCNKLSARIENLNASSGVFAHIDLSRAIDANATRIGKHSCNNALGSRSEEHKY